MHIYTRDVQNMYKQVVLYENERLYASAKIIIP